MFCHNCHALRRHALEELTPEIPFVVTGANKGCVLAANGFSFVDEYGVTRYFALLGGMKDFEPPIFGGEF